MSVSHDLCRPVKIDRIPFQRTNLAGYEGKQGFSDPKMPKIHLNYGPAVVTMMFSKVKAPSWLPPLPGCERSANMEYAEWAPVGTLRWAEDGQLACPPLGWALLGGQQSSRFDRLQSSKSSFRSPNEDCKFLFQHIRWPLV